MVKGEWKSLWKNKILVVVLIAIIAIPTIYTTLFLGSMWDPYGQLDKLPVAVVNQDEAVTYNGDTLEVGQNLIDNLKKNDSLQFHFVSKEDAEKGLKDGTYYMSITVPKNFSENAATLLDEKPKKMQLQYKTNPGTNYIASKLSESAMLKIKSAVSSEVTQTYARTMFSQIKEAGNGMQTAVDGTSKLLDGVEKLNQGNAKVESNLNLLAESAKTFQKGSVDLKKGLSSYTDGVSQVNNGAKQLKEGTKALQTKAMDGTSQLVTGSKDLNNGVGAYTDGVKKAADGADALSKNSQALISGATDLQNGTKTLKEGSASVLSGLQQLSGEIGNSITPEKKAQLEELQRGIDSLQAGVGALNTAVQGVEIPNIEGTIGAITTPIQAMGKDAQSVGNSLANTQTYLTTLAQAHPELMGDENFQGVLAELKVAGENLGDMNGQFQTLKKEMGNLPDTSLLTTTLQGLKSNVGQLAEGANQVLPGSKQAVSELTQGMMNVKDALDRTGTTKQDMGILQGMQLVNNGIGAVYTGAGTLQSGVTAYTAGTSQVNEGLKQLKEKNQTLKEGTATLNSGIQKLSSGLDSGIKQLDGGVTSLSDGTKTLVKNSPELVAGSQKLSDGATKIQEGSAQLAKGSTTLGEGLNSAADGVNSLQLGLSDGASQVKKVNGTNDIVSMFAEPIETVEQKASDVENNGHAMAAYMMSVALWVGCIAFCIMYPLTQYSGTLKSGFSWWISKATVVYPISIIMALCMIGMLKMINGFQPVEWGNTILVACLASIAFMSIMYFFNVWLGKVGSFLMLIFMVVQLAGSAGTYPIELSGDFVSKIHKWLPFSYTVDAFRSTIAGGGSIAHAVVVLIILILIFTGLTIMLFQIRGRRMKLGKHVVYDYLEKGGLA